MSDITAFEIGGKRVDFIEPQPKQGHPKDRKVCADFMRCQRARFPELKGGWSRRDWNTQVHVAGRNNLARMTAVRKQVDQSMARIEAEANAEARAIVAARDDIHTGRGPSYHKALVAQQQQEQIRGAFPR